MSEYLMGVDIGTTGAKAMIIDTKGNIVSSGYREYPCVYPKENWVEQSAEMVVQKTFEACRQAIMDSPISSNQISAVGFSAQRATFALIDKNQKVIEDRFYVWQDNRAISEMDEITTRMDPFELYSIQGQPVTPTFSLEKIFWIKKHDPDTYKKAEKIVMVPDYILYRFGIDGFLCEVANAGCSSMVDIQKNTWSDKILNAYEIDRNKLPELIDAGIAVGSVSQEAAQFTGLKQGTILCSGSGDNQCGALGAGVIKKGHASMSLGTSGVLVVGSDQPLFLKDMGLMVSKALVPNLYELEGIQLGAASSYRWIRDILCENEKVFAESVGADPFTMMEKHIENSDVGANGVIFMPYLSGAGYPHWHVDAKGVFSGIRFTTTKSDMVRAVMEGITLESKDMYETLKNSGIEINQLSIIGGATKSKAWRQMISDMFNVEVRKPKVTDSTIIGAAILAGVGSKIFKDVEEGVKRMVQYADVVTPIPENVMTYNTIYSKYTKIYQAMGPVF